MCLIYKPFNLNKLPDTITGYKVYVGFTDNDHIMSPHYPHARYGVIKKAGTLRVPIPVAFSALDGHLSSRLWSNHTYSKRLWSNHTYSNLQKFKKRTLQIAGFYVFLRRKDAERYIRKSFSPRFFRFRKTVIVPVQIQKKDIHATGYTPIFGSHIFGIFGPNIKMKTYVCQAITITEEAFNQCV